MLLNSVKDFLLFKTYFLRVLDSFTSIHNGLHRTIIYNGRQKNNVFLHFFLCILLCQAQTISPRKLRQSL